MQSKAEFRVQSLFELTTTPATSTGRHGPFLLVRLRVWPERHLAQSCAIALRSPVSERPSDLKRYSPDIHSKPACLLVLCSLQRRPGRVLCFTGAYHHRHRVRVRVRVRIRVRVRVRALDRTSHREDEDERERCARMRRNSNASLTKVCTLREEYWSTWSSSAGSRQNSNASLHVCAVHMHDEVLEGDEVLEYLEEYLEKSPSLDPTFANVGGIREQPPDSVPVAG